MVASSFPSLMCLHVTLTIELEPILECFPYSTTSRLEEEVVLLSHILAHYNRVFELPAMVCLNDKSLKHAATFQM